MWKCFIWKKNLFYIVLSPYNFDIESETKSDNSSMHVVTILILYLSFIDTQDQLKVYLLNCYTPDIVCIFKTIDSQKLFELWIFLPNIILSNILHHSFKHTEIHFLFQTLQKIVDYAKQIYFNTRRWNVRQLCSSKSIYLLTNILT